ncbi:mechanosensitive ion channel family protein [Halorientalis sp.]|uniref:mechanosensitive ion channel family protein n=1 Tax=Halorientalis sp. TaxID=1931229 RepID=UPI00260B821C|nr:mechanosensitive ion channel family protein [Halorientalis sp.]
MSGLLGIEPASGDVLARVSTSAQAPAGGGSTVVSEGTWVVAATRQSAERLLPTRWLPFPVPGWTVDIVATVLILGLAWATSRLVVVVFSRRIARRFRRPSITRTVLRALRVGIFVFAILAILPIYGVSPSDITLSVAVFSAAIGVVLAPIVGSIISGVFLLADQPYEIGDMVEITDTSQRGFVDDITLRYTKIITLDNTFVVVPNGEIRARDVVNYSAEDPRTRRTLDIVVTYEGDLTKARDLTERAAKDVDRVIEGGPDIRVGSARYPAAPTCYIEGFGDHGVHLRLRYWLEEPYKLLATRSQVQTSVWGRLEDADVEFAYPHQQHVFDETSGQMDVSVSSPRQRTGPGANSEKTGSDTSNGGDKDPHEPPG